MCEQYSGLAGNNKEGSGVVPLQVEAQSLSRPICNCMLQSSYRVPLGLLLTGFEEGVLTCSRKLGFYFVYVTAEQTPHRWFFLPQCHLSLITLHYANPSLNGSGGGRHQRCHSSD